MSLRVTRRTVANAINPTRAIDFTYNRSMYGRWVDADTFVVFSYRDSWPIAYYCNVTSRWTMQRQKYSSTTSAHCGLVAYAIGNYRELPTVAAMLAELQTRRDLSRTFAEVA